jgi:hypothetical protein
MGEYDDSEFYFLMKCGESYWNEFNFECQYTEISCPCQKGNWYQACACCHQVYERSLRRDLRELEVLLFEKDTCTRCKETVVVIVQQESWKSR